jgi:cytochrome b pre-mRNA-processing protein 3
MLNISGKSRALKSAASRLNVGIVSRSREPVFYAKLGVADTVDGRFDLIVLHAWLVLERLRAQRLNDLSQALTDALFVSFDEGLRDLGSGDMGLGRRMKAIADAFYGRFKAYGAAEGAPAMAEALERNLFRGADAPHSADVARYVLSAREHLGQEDLASGEVDFGPLP